MIPLVTLDLYRVKHPLWGVLHMAWDHVPLKLTRDVSFYKLLGTGRGDTFGLDDADPSVWAVLSVQKSTNEPIRLRRMFERWLRQSTEHVRITLVPIAGKGTWSGSSPFEYSQQRTDKPIAVITRARIKPREWRSFYNNVHAVVQDLEQQEGLLFRIGIGEAPIGLQGTFSIWRNAEDIATFAYKNRAHAEVITKTHARDWYSEELFARFEVADISGKWTGLNL